MKHDFETLTDRSRAGSVKWDLMLEKDPEVPAGIVPFSIGDMDLKTPSDVVDGLKRYLDASVLGYTNPTAADRRATVEWMRRRHDWTIDPDWIVHVDGIVPALYTAVREFAAEGEGVVYMPPVYRPLYHAIHDTGRRPVSVPLLLDDAGYAMNFDALERAAARPDVKLLLFCSPHNPVARVWRRDELERMGDICRRHGVLVVSDEIHMDFTMPGHKHRVFASLGDECKHNCIVCTAPSKTFNIAGLQVSGIVIPNESIRERFADAHRNTGRYDPNQLGLAACRIAYDRCGGWLDAVLGLIRENGIMVRGFMAEHYREIRVFPHEGTYFIWLDFRPWKQGTDDLERFMTRSARLFLDEGYVFGEEGWGFERINLACPRWVLRDALDRLLQAGRP